MIDIFMFIQNFMVFPFAERKFRLKTDNARNILVVTSFKLVFNAFSASRAETKPKKH